MIVEVDKHGVESLGFQQTKNAEIKATPQMLRMLSSGIYSDKIQAFIRELSTNAYDAMLEKGTFNSHNVEVHLPTVLEPWFAIRDYGTGLSHLGMETNFSNFGDGTKANSNNYNGAFGLGSKSPLSYTRDFTIISYHNGIKTFYNYGKNDEDIPMLSTAFSEPSDEPSGLMIQVPIEEKDISEVIYKAELIYRYFDKRPDMNVKLEYQELNKVIDGDGWFLTDKDKSKSGYVLTTPTKVVMANVAYPISNLQSNDEIWWLTQSPFVIQAETGSVNITPSRESLEMTPKTRTFLEAKAKEILKQLGKNIEDKLPKDLCMYDKIIKSYEFIASLPNSIRSFNIGKFTIDTNSYRGICPLDVKFNDKLTFVRFSRLSSYTFKKRQEYPFDNSKFRPINASYVYLVVDSNRRLPEITQKLKDKYDHVYIIKPIVPRAQLHDLEAKTFKEAYTKFIEDIGSPKFSLASTEAGLLPPLVKVPQVKGVKQPKTKAVLKVQRVRLTDYARGTNQFDDIDDTLKGPFYYINSYRGDFTNSAGNRDYTIGYTLGILCGLLKIKTVYTIPPNQTKRVKADSRFVEITDYFKDKAKGLVLEINEIPAKLKDLFNRLYITQSVKDYLIDNYPDEPIVKGLIGTKMTTNSLASNTKKALEDYGVKLVNKNITSSVDYTEEVAKFKVLEGLNYSANDWMIKLVVDAIIKMSKEEKLKGKVDETTSKI